VRYMAVASGLKLSVKRVHMCVTNGNEDQTIKNKAKCLEVLSYNKERETNKELVFLRQCCTLLLTCISIRLEQLALSFFYVIRILILDIKGDH